MSDLSLFNIETGLADMLQLREEMQANNEDTSVLDGQIAQYFAAEVRKVDNIRAYYRHCELMAAGAKEEADRQSARVRVWENRKAELRRLIQAAMEASGVKKIEGRTGSFLLKGNGGQQALTIVTPEMVPEECKVAMIRLPLQQWRRISNWLRGSFLHGVQIQEEISISNETVRMFLAQSCSVCGEDAESIAACPVCGGSGKQGVPGARLEPRGSHVEIK